MKVKISDVNALLQVYSIYYPKRVDILLVITHYKVGLVYHRFLLQDLLGAMISQEMTCNYFEYQELLLEIYDCWGVSGEFRKEREK